tara:strand:+ start:613 stop:1212 length:600 start_codon:yes stop_codon:yes gene_type:complete
MQRKVITLLSASALAMTVGATHVQAGFLSGLKNAAKSVEHKVEDAAKSVEHKVEDIAKKLKGGAKKAFEKAKKVGDKFVIDAKHVKDFVKENAKKYGPTAADKFISVAKTMGKDGAKFAEWAVKHRSVVEEALMPALEAGKVALPVVGFAAGEIPVAGSVLSTIIETAGPKALDVTKFAIESDLKAQSGQKTEIEGYTE